MTKTVRFREKVCYDLGMSPCETAEFLVAQLKHHVNIHCEEARKHNDEWEADVLFELGYPRK